MLLLLLLLLLFDGVGVVVVVVVVAVLDPVFRDMVASDRELVVVEESERME